MLIAVSGMVGTGKTTLARALAGYFGFAAELEAVGEDNPWLSAFYGGREESMRRHALSLQLHFLARRMETMRRVQAQGGEWIIDRTWYEDADVFARGLYEQALLSPLEWDLYRRLYAELVHSVAARPPRLVLYLHGPLHEIIARIEERGRPEERHVSTGYWAGLHDRYRRWVRDFHLCRIVTLDIRDHDLVAEPGSIEAVASLVKRELGREIERTGMQYGLGMR